MSWKDAPEVDSAAAPKWAAAPEVDAQERPGLLRRALTWASTPSDAMKPAMAENKAIANAAGPSVAERVLPSGALPAAEAVVSGMPGHDPYAASGVEDERQAQFAQANPKGALLLRLVGGMANPVLPSSRAPGGVARALDEAGTAMGRRVLTGGANPMQVRAPVSAEAVDEAFRQGAFRPFGTTQKAADVLEGARESVGADYARIVAELEAKGVSGPDARVLARQYAEESARVGANTMNPTVPGIYETAATQVASKPTSASGRLALTQAENMKRSLQDQARSAYRQLAPNEVGQAHEATASMMRQAVEDEIAQQASKAPEVAERFVPVKEQFGRVAEASDAATKGAAQAARRATFSLPDYILASGPAAHNPLEGGAALILSKLVRTYGPSTTTWLLKNAARGATRLPEVPAAVSRPALLDILEQLRMNRSSARPAQLAQGE